MSEPEIVAVATHIIGRVPESDEVWINAIDVSIDVTDPHIQTTAKQFCRDNGVEPVGFLRVFRCDGKLSPFYSCFEEPILRREQGVMDSAILLVMQGTDGYIENHDDAVLSAENQLLAHKVERMFGGGLA
jgi:hypothetical protein